MTQNFSAELLQDVSNTIRFLAVDGVEKANSGHPGMPMGMADLAAVLWLKYLKHNPKDSSWLSRDRFVLSNGHGSMLIYSMLHLSGYKVSLDDLKNFRQQNSNTPGHPESFMTDGVETTTGPLGQGIGNAVGMAIAQKSMAARYGSSSFNPVDHKVWCFCGDGCLMEGVSSEASSLAGHLGLDNLILVYDDNHITIAGRTDLAFTEDVEARYKSYGFHAIRVDGHDHTKIDAAYKEALSVKGKPVIILAKTIIGKGSPNKSDSYGIHGSPLGSDELRLTKEALGWPLEPTFLIPDQVSKAFSERLESLVSDYKAWNVEFGKWEGDNSDLASQLKTQLVCGIPENLEQLLIDSVPPSDKAVATRKLSESVLQVASKHVSSLLGGSADLEPSTLTYIKGESDIQKGAFSGRNLRFGVREHGMGAIMNGLSYYGGFIPYGSTFMCFIDYMKPTVRLAALSKIRGLFIYTHDSIFLGEDGPTHQPIEHMQMMRTIPNLNTFRPADGLETAVCYSEAIKRSDGPSAMVLTRQGLPSLERPASFSPSDIARGAYVCFESDATKKPEVVFVATGSEVSLALETAKMLASSCAVRLVSMPCYELFAKQPKTYQEELIPRSAKKVCVEAGVTLGWRDMVSGSVDDTLCIGIDRFGASAPAELLAEKFGFTPEQVLEKTKAFFAIK